MCKPCLVLLEQPIASPSVLHDSRLSILPDTKPILKRTIPNRRITRVLFPGAQRGCLGRKPNRSRISWQLPVVTRAVRLLFESRIYLR